MYVAFIVISCSLLVNGQTGTEPISSQPDSVQTTTQPNVTPQPAQCVSINEWNKLEGLCINRSHCDYGTPAIDFTLYAARGSKRYDAFGSHLNIKHIKNSQKLLNGFSNFCRPCPSDKVCCPINYIIPDSPPKDEGLPSQYNRNGDVDDSDESNLSDY